MNQARAAQTPDAATSQQKGQFLYLVKTAALTIQQFAEPTLSVLGVTVTQYEILALVRANAGTSIAALARHLGTSRQSAGEQVKMLEAKGFLFSVPNSMRPRSVSLSLSLAGTSMLEQADLLVEAAERRVMKSIAASDQATTRRVMRQLIAECRDAAAAFVQAPTR